jgi:hypothetical protein
MKPAAEAPALYRLFTDLRQGMRSLSSGRRFAAAYPVNQGVGAYAVSLSGQAATNSTSIPSSPTNRPLRRSR